MILRSKVWHMFVRAGHRRDATQEAEGSEGMEAPAEAKSELSRKLAGVTDHYNAIGTLPHLAGGVEQSGSSSGS